MGLSLRAPTPRINECLRQREQQVGRALPRQCTWTRTSRTHMRCHPILVAICSGGGSIGILWRGLRPQGSSKLGTLERAMFQEDVSGLGCSWLRVCASGPYARLVDAAGAAVHEEAAPAKGRPFVRSHTKLKSLVDFFKQSAEAYGVVTVPSVDPDAALQAWYQNPRDTSRRNVLPPLQMWRSHEVNADTARLKRVQGI